MKGTLRDLIARGVIAVAVFAGSYAVLVAPSRDELAQTRARTSSAQQELAEVEQLQNRLAQMTAALSRASDEAAAIERMGVMASDHRRLFAAIMRIGGEHGVRVDQLTPLGAVAPPQGISPDDARLDSTVAYRTTVIAPYERLPGFLHALRTGMGYAIIRSVRLSPTLNENNDVHAIIETEHSRFDPTVITGTDVRTADAEEKRR